MLQQIYPPTKTEPWQHQTDFWNLSKDHRGYYAAHDMGAGKSKAAIDYVNGINANFILIVCPRTVMQVWPYQFGIHSFDHYEPIIADKKSWNARRKAEYIDNKLKQYKTLGKKCMVIINYETVWRAPLGPSYHPKTKRMMRKGFLHWCGFDAMLLDEAHRIKAPFGQASRGCTTISKSAKRRLLLSGTPMPHSPLDIFAQFRLMDPSIFGFSFVRFRAKYAVMGGFENKQVIGYNDLDALHRKFYSRAHRVEIDDVVELPEFQDEYRYCTLPPKVMKLYKEMDRELIVGVGSGEITASNGLVKMLRLAQIAGGVVKLDDGSEEVIDNSKVEIVQQIIEDLPNEEPLVIFARFTMEIKRTREVAEKLGRKVGEISGRADDYGAWLAGDINCVVVQIKSGAEGLDFTRARYTIYISKGLSLGTYTQSRRRVRRPGQKRAGIYFHILAEKTIDIKEDKALRAKKRVVDYVLKDIRDHL